MGRRVLSGLFGSLGRPPTVVGFIRVPLVHSGAPRGSSSSFWFDSARPGSCHVHSRSLGSYKGRGNHSGSFGFVCVRLVNSGAPGRSSGSLWPAPEVVGFIGVRLLH